MKLTIAWNVWNNYEDLLLGSEIARLQNEELGTFESLHLMSQGGYPEPPSQRQSQYIDDHLTVEINEDHELIKLGIKFKAMFRVLCGIRQAYEYAKQNGSDYAVVTAADAWCLDLPRTKTLLQDADVQRNAVSARIGLVTGLDLSWGSYAPFFDDHFIIVNIPVCEEHGVFDYDVPKAYNAHFFNFGSIHYVWTALMNERVPPGLFNAYTDLQDCVNHFGEKSAHSILPWQYQPKYGFLHANCFEEPELHPLRAQLLRHKDLDRYPVTGAYCQAYSDDAKEFANSADYVFYRQTWMERAKINLLWWPRKQYMRGLRLLKYKRYQKVKRGLIPTFDPFRFYDMYEDVMPLALTSRRRPSKAPQSSATIKDVSTEA